MMIANYGSHDRYSEIASLAAGSFVVVACAYMGNDTGIVSGVVIALIGSTNYKNEITDFLQRSDHSELPPRQPDYWVNP